MTWRWCFYINLPLGAVTVLFILIFYKPNPSARAQKLDDGWKARIQQFDIYGTIVFLPMVICLLLALQWGGSKYDWNSGTIIALLVVFAVLAASFIAIQFWKKDNATVPIRILTIREMAGGVWFMFCLGAAFFVSNRSITSTST